MRLPGVPVCPVPAFIRSRWREAVYLAGGGNAIFVFGVWGALTRVGLGSDGGISAKKPGTNLKSRRSCPSPAGLYAGQK
jgi:hypothetical protein